MKLLRVTALCIALSCALLTGCASLLAYQAEIDQKKDEIQRTIPVCVSEKDCNAKWDAAQLWVAHNIAPGIRLVTNVLIETYDAPADTAYLAVRVTKEPAGDGKYVLLIQTTCETVGCFPDDLDASLDFNRTIGATHA